MFALPIMRRRLGFIEPLAQFVFRQWHGQPRRTVGRLNLHAIEKTTLRKLRVIWCTHTSASADLLEHPYPREIHRL